MSWYIRDFMGNEYDPLQTYYEEKIAGIHKVRMSDIRNENLRNANDYYNANDYEETDNYAPCLKILNK